MKLTVQVRTETGKNVKKLRKSWYVPAVVYGKMLDTPVLLTILKNIQVKNFNLHDVFKWLKMLRDIKNKNGE